MKPNLPFITFLICVLGGYLRNLCFTPCGETLALFLWPTAGGSGRQEAELGMGEGGLGEGENSREKYDRRASSRESRVSHDLPAAGGRHEGHERRTKNSR